MSKPTLEQYRKAAKRLHHDEGNVEVDYPGRTPVSTGDPNGAYVQAWVWVPNSEACQEAKEIAR